MMRARRVARRRIPWWQTAVPSPWRSGGWRRMVRWWTGPLAIVSGLVCFGSLAAQESMTGDRFRLNGRVVTVDGGPIPDLMVVLHGVGSAGGAPVARTTSDLAGRFTLVLPDSADPAAIYFAAVRYANGLYVGPMFRIPPGAEPYEITVDGTPAFTASASSAERASGGDIGAAPGPGTRGEMLPDRGPGPHHWIAGLACLAAAAMLWMGLASSPVRPNTQRRLLRELAVLESAYQTARPRSPEESNESAAGYHRDRAALIERLRQTVQE